MAVSDVLSAVDWDSIDRYLRRNPRFAKIVEEHDAKAKLAIAEYRAESARKMEAAKGYVVAKRGPDYSVACSCTGPF